MDSNGKRYWNTSVSDVEAADVFIRGYGLGDLIGWAPTLIRPEHVGQVLARFLAIEVKTSHGRFSEAQRRFLHAVNQAGGLGLECRDPAQVAKLLSR